MRIRIRMDFASSRITLVPAWNTVTTLAYGISIQHGGIEGRPEPFFSSSFKLKLKKRTPETEVLEKGNLV